MRRHRQLSVSADRRQNLEHRKLEHRNLQYGQAVRASPRLRYWAAWSFFSLKKTRGQAKFIANYTQPPCQHCTVCNQVRCRLLGLTHLGDIKSKCEAMSLPAALQPNQICSIPHAGIEDGPSDTKYGACSKTIVNAVTIGAAALLACCEPMNSAGRAHTWWAPRRLADSFEPAHQHLHQVWHRFGTACLGFTGSERTILSRHPWWPDRQPDRQTLVWQWKGSA